MNTHESTARLADVRSRGVENAFALARAATSVFERIARQNYAVMGDVVDYSLEQIRIPTRHSDPRAVIEAQAAGTRGFAERARTRADEYAAIVGEMRELVGGAVGRTAASARGAVDAGARAATDVATDAGAKASSAARAAPEPATGTAAANGTGTVVPIADAAAVPPGTDPATARAAVAKVKRQAAKAADAANARDGAKSGAKADGKTGTKPGAKAATGGTPIILPGDSPKAAVRKGAAAAAANKSVVKKRAAATASAAKPASKTRATAKRSAVKTTRRGAKG